MLGKEMTMPRVSGTSGLQLFDYKFGQTGIHGTEIDNYDGNLGQTYVEELIRPQFMQDDTKIHMKIIYDKDTHRILGGQVMSKEDITASINTISVVISADSHLNSSLSKISSSNLIMIDHGITLMF